MAKLSNEELLDAFKEMTLIELSEFVKQFEETFDVSAAAPVAVAAAAGAPAAGGEAGAAEGRVGSLAQLVHSATLAQARDGGGAYARVAPRCSAAPARSVRRRETPARRCA